MRFENPKTSKKPSCSGGGGKFQLLNRCQSYHDIITRGDKTKPGGVSSWTAVERKMHHHRFMFFFSKFGGKACSNKSSAGDQLLV